MKPKIIQVIGIPGSGKSYLLKKYFERNPPSTFRLVEFGQNLRDLRKEDSNQHDLDYYVTSLIGKILAEEKNSVISSHLVHRDHGSYSWYFKYDRMAGTVAYVHIITPPNQIYEQRMQDNDDRTKSRNDDSVDILAEHQRISLEKTIEIATELSADILVLHNLPERTERNLKTLNHYFSYYFNRI